MREFDTLQNCRVLSSLYNMGYTYDLPVTDSPGSITANTSEWQNPMASNRFASATLGINFSLLGIKLNNLLTYLLQAYKYVINTRSLITKNPFSHICMHIAWLLKNGCMKSHQESTSNFLLISKSDLPSLQLSWFWMSKHPGEWSPCLNL